MSISPASNDEEEKKFIETPGSLSQAQKPGIKQCSHGFQAEQPPEILRVYV